jgi:hypothetical protein
MILLMIEVALLFGKKWRGMMGVVRGGGTLARRLVFW